MKRSPKVSVLLPFFQAEATLAAALESMRRQSLENWECVLVDDGSSDASSQLACEVLRQDRRFKLVTLGHGGPVTALNAGIEHCTAPLVARMDADDVMRRDRLAAQHDMLEGAPELAAVGCHVRIFPRRDLTDGLRRYERWLNGVSGPASLRHDAFVESPLAHPTLMIRGEVLRRFGYRDAGWPEDYDLLLRLLVAGHEIGMVRRRLLAWRDSPRRLTRTGEVYRLERIVACKAFYLAEQFLSRSPSYILWGHGGTGRALRRALLAHGKAPTYIVEMHPGRLAQRIHGALVVHPDALATLPRLPLVASVAGEKPRRQIRAFLSQRGWVEGRDFVCAA